MAFDGTTIHALVSELSQKLQGARIYKIAQTESDELYLTIKGPNVNQKLLISVNPSLPLIYLTEDSKNSPLSAPAFCMLLRKHLGNGRIISISQPSLERVIVFDIEHLNEMGDLCRKKLYIELMGKYSNIIFCDESDTIIDSIKRIPLSVSSIREVLPGRQYFIPDSLEKKNPLTTDKNEFIANVFSKSMPLPRAILNTYTGISPIISEEIVFLAGLDASTFATEISSDYQLHIYNIFKNFFEKISENAFAPVIYYKNGKPFEFSAIPLSSLKDLEQKTTESISETLYEFYNTKNSISRMNSKSSELRRHIQSLIEKDAKKLSLWEAQLKDTAKADKYRLYGELLNTYGYNVTPGAKSITVLNYYDNTEITIPLDNNFTVRENSVRYFNRYNKLKRTAAANEELRVKTTNELYYLESIINALDMASGEEDIQAIRDELSNAGYVKRKNQKQKSQVKSKPLHYISSDGFEIFVGKNNIQNEEISFKIANGNDLWFHAKDVPGSHVIVKTNGNEIPDKTYEEAAAIAAFYSKNKTQSKVEVDYTERKNLKKPNASNPGFVIYHQNYSMVITPDSCEHLAQSEKSPTSKR